MPNDQKILVWKDKEGKSLNLGRHSKGNFSIDFHFSAVMEIVSDLNILELDKLDNRDWTKSEWSIDNLMELISLYLKATKFIEISMLLRRDSKINAAYSTLNKYIHSVKTWGKLLRYWKFNKKLVQYFCWSIHLRRVQMCCNDRIWESHAL